MPVKRNQLSPGQRDTYLALARELRDWGLDCEIPDELEENRRGLDIFVAAPPGNLLLELPTGVTRCAFWVHLVALFSNLILEDFSITSEQDPELIVLYPNSKGHDGGQLDPREILNDRIENGLHFRRSGDVAQGWLLVSGHKPIPRKYRNGMTMELRLTFIDQYGTSTLRKRRRSWREARA